MFARREVKIGGLTLTGTFPRMIVYVKHGSRRNRDAFRKACRKYGIDIDLDDTGAPKIIQILDGEGREYAKDKLTSETYAIPDGVAVYDVAGTPQALGELITLPCIIDAHYALDVGVPRSHYDEKELPTSGGPRFFQNSKPMPRVPREVRVKQQTEQRRKAVANVKYWENVKKAEQIDEFGTAF